MALLLALIAITVTAVLAYSYLGAQGASIGIARNVSSNARARYVADSGLDLTLAYIEATSSWRTAKPNGTWVTDQSLCGGTVTIRVEDGSDADDDGTISVPAEGDASLADNPTDKFTVTAIGKLETRDPVTNQLLWSVTHLARAAVTPVGTDLVGNWNLDEGGGTSVSGGNGHTGTMVNMSPSTSWTTGRFGSALRFDGTNDYVTTPDADDLDMTTAGTVSAWININSFKETFAGIVHKGSRSDFADEAYTLQFWSGNKIYWGITSETGQSLSITSPSTPATGSWIHVLGTWDSTSMKLYVNGTLVGSRSGAVALASNGALNIGGQLNGSTTYSFDGRIDDVRIYNRALTAAEAATLAAGGSLSSGSTGYLVDWRP